MSSLCVIVSGASVVCSQDWTHIWSLLHSHVWPLARGWGPGWGIHRNITMWPLRVACASSQCGGWFRGQASRRAGEAMLPPMTQPWEPQCYFCCVLLVEAVTGVHPGLRGENWTWLLEAGVSMSHNKKSTWDGMFNGVAMFGKFSLHQEVALRSNFYTIIALL